MGTTETILTLGPVHRLDSTLAVELGLQPTLPMPDQDDQLPDRLEAFVHHAGLEVQRRPFRALIEEADQELVPSRRRGKAGGGIQRRGTRPFTFKTIFGAVTVRRSRIRHNHDGALETPSAAAWATPHQLAITGHLRDAVRDRMGAQSAGRSRDDIGREAGDEDPPGRSAIVEIVHQEGARLIAAQHTRARSILDDAPEAQRASLGPAVSDVVVDDLSDVPPCDDPEEAEARWEGGPAEWAATGFAGAEPAFPVAADEPRAVDEGFVIVEPDEVKTKAQPGTGRKEVWTYTAVMLVAGWRHVSAEATAEGLWSQVGALLLGLGVLNGERRSLVLGDGASWIRSWFEGLGIASKAMIVRWWHPRKRRYESMSGAGGPKDRRRAFEKELRGQLWEGKVDTAVELPRGTLEWVRTPKAVEELIGYLEKRRGFIPDYQRRRRSGLWIASTRVEKFNDRAVSERCKHRGMSRSPRGVLALATLEAARRNGELEHWRQADELPERTRPEPIRTAA